MEGTELRPHHITDHRTGSPVFCRVSRANLDSLWKQIGNMWAKDGFRTDRPQVLYHAVCLGLVDLWTVRMLGDLVGVILTVPESSRLKIFFTVASGIESWIEPACEYLGRFARDHGYSVVDLFCRKGWKEYAAQFPRQNPELKVEIHRDPSRLPALRVS
jgi:hypothetical protein